MFSLLGLVLTESQLSVSVDGVLGGWWGWGLKGKSSQYSSASRSAASRPPGRSALMKFLPFGNAPSQLPRTSLGADFYSRRWILFVSLLSEATAQILFETLLYLPQLLNSAGGRNWNNLVYLATLYVLFRTRVFPVRENTWSNKPLNRYNKSSFTTRVTTYEFYLQQLTNSLIILQYLIRTLFFLLDSKQRVCF